MVGGSYPEWLKVHGVMPQDARLDIPELLGISKTTIATNPIFATDAANLGDYAGQGYGSMRTNTFRRFIPEHGLIMSLLWAKPRNIYLDAKHRSWLYQDKEDFYTKSLTEIGMSEVTAEEVYPGGGTAVHGYAPNYQEYTYNKSHVAGAFRGTKLDYHMGRDFV